MVLAEQSEREKKYLNSIIIRHQNMVNEVNTKRIVK